MNFGFKPKDFFGDPSWPIEKSSEQIINQANKQEGKIINSSSISNQELIIEEYFEDDNISYNSQYNLLKISDLLVNLDHRDLFDVKYKNLIRNQEQNIRSIGVDIFPSQDQDSISNSQLFNKITIKKPFQRKKSQKIDQYSSDSYFIEYQNSLKKQNMEDCTKIQRKQQIQLSDSIQMDQKQEATRLKFEESQINSEPHQFSLSNGLGSKFCYSQDLFFQVDIEKNILQKLRYYQIQDISRKQQNGNEQNEKQKIKRIKSCKYKILSQQEKQYLVHLSGFLGLKQVSDKFNVSVNNLSRWRKNCNRKSGGGRRILDQELQKKMINFVKNIIKEGKKLTRKLIQNKAKQLSKIKTFKASKGWLKDFYKKLFFVYKQFFFFWKIINLEEIIEIIGISNLSIMVSIQFTKY